MSPEAGQKVCETLYSGWIGQGSQVELFEQRLADYLGTRQVVTVNSGTAALQLALKLVCQPGQEVIVPPLTCFATTAAILATGLRPKWADISLKTFNVDLDDVERKLSPTTRAIVLVHLGGLPVDLDRVAEIQRTCHRKFGFTPAVIEDAAHAFGAEYRGRKLGTHSNIVCYSFQAIKTLTCGDGGLLVLPNSELYDRAKRLRWFGLDREDRSRPIDESGFKFHMNDIQAAIGLANLPHVDSLLACQRENYRQLKKALSYLRIREDNDLDCTGWAFPIRVDRKLNFERELAVRGIGSGLHHYRNDVQPCVAEFRTQLPNMDALEQDLTCVPCGWWVGPAERNYIAQIILRGW